jgi:hypothetical protein
LPEFQDQITNRARELQTDRFDSLVKDKQELIDFACEGLKRLGININSFADLGAVWGVDGGYTFYTMEKHRIKNAFLVDFHLTEKVKDESEKHPDLKVILGDFSSKEVAEQIGNVDAVFLFDTLLHQVAPDWDEVLEMYANRVKVFLIYNQQFVASKSTVRLLDLGEEEYFKNVPHTQDEEPYKTAFGKMYEIHPDRVPTSTPRYLCYLAMGDCR